MSEEKLSAAEAPEAEPQASEVAEAAQATGVRKFVERALSEALEFAEYEETVNYLEAFAEQYDIKNYSIVVKKKIIALKTMIPTWRDLKLRALYDFFGVREGSFIYVYVVYGDATKSTIADLLDATITTVYNDYLFKLTDFLVVQLKYNDYTVFVCF